MLYGANIEGRAYIIGKGPCTMFDVVRGNSIGGRAYIIGKGPCTVFDVVGGKHRGTGLHHREGALYRV